MAAELACRFLEILMKSSADKLKSGQASNTTVRTQNLMATFCPLGVGIREKVSRILITLTYLLSASNI